MHKSILVAAHSKFTYVNCCEPYLFYTFIHLCVIVHKLTQRNFILLCTVHCFHTNSLRANKFQHLRLLIKFSCHLLVLSVTNTICKLWFFYCAIWQVFKNYRLLILVSSHCYLNYYFFVFFCKKAWQIKKNMFKFRSMPHNEV